MNRFQKYRLEDKMLLARVPLVLALLVAFMAVCLILPSMTPAFQPPNNSPQLGQRPNPNAGWTAEQLAQIEEVKRQRREWQSSQWWRNPGAIIQKLQQDTGLY